MVLASLTTNQAEKPEVHQAVEVGAEASSLWPQASACWIAERLDRVSVQRLMFHDVSPE